ncbi:hypothetical protein Tco_0351585 [Tanacetum coccineum]
MCEDDKVNVCDVTCHSRSCLTCGTGNVSDLDSLMLIRSPRATFESYDDDLNISSNEIEKMEQELWTLSLKGGWDSEASACF